MYPDWTSDDYIEKINFFFKSYGLERVKVFSVVTNLRAKHFQSAMDIYFGSEKVIFCLAHQLNNKFNQILLSCDYEEDKLHFEKKYKELTSIPDQKDEQNENYGSDQQYYSDENYNSNDDKEDDKDDFDKNEKARENEAGEDYDDVALNDLNKDEDDEEDDFVEDEDLAYVKLFEEPTGIYDELTNCKGDDGIF